MSWDYINIDVDTMDFAAIPVHTKRTIADAIDRERGLDVVLSMHNTDGDKIKSRLLSAGILRNGDYYIAYWSCEDDTLQYHEFTKPAMEQDFD